MTKLQFIRIKTLTDEELCNDNDVK